MGGRVRRVRRGGAGSSLPPHSWWGVYVTATEGAGYVSLAEVQFRTVRGGPQAAVGGTAIGTSQYDTISYAYANAFDGDASTKWASAAGPPQRIGYHFAAPVSIAQVMLQCRPDSMDQAPGVFATQYSDDGVTWTTTPAGASPMQPTWGASEIRVFSV